MLVVACTHASVCYKHRRMRLCHRSEHACWRTCCPRLYPHRSLVSAREGAAWQAEGEEEGEFWVHDTIQQQYIHVHEYVPPNYPPGSFLVVLSSSTMRRVWSMCSVCMLVGVAFDPCTRVNWENVLPGLNARPGTDLHMPAHRIGSQSSHVFSTSCLNAKTYLSIRLVFLVFAIQLQEWEPCCPIKLQNFWILHSDWFTQSMLLNHRLEKCSR